MKRKRASIPLMQAQKTLESLELLALVSSRGQNHTFWQKRQKSRKDNEKVNQLSILTRVEVPINIPDDSSSELDDLHAQLPKPATIVVPNPSKSPVLPALPTIVSNIFVKRNGKLLGGYDQRSISPSQSYSALRDMICKYVMSTKVKKDVFDPELDMRLGCSWIATTKSPLKPLADGEYGNFNDDDAFEAVQELIRGSMSSKKPMLLSIMAWIEVDEPSKAPATRHGAGGTTDEEERQLATARKVILCKIHEKLTFSDFHNRATSKASCAA